MRILIAPDSFKNCLTARAVAEALADGIRSVCSDAQIDIIPLSDGGDGLLSVISERVGGKLIECQTRDPLGRAIKAAWLKTDNYAIIEMALASGLSLLKYPEEYAPLLTSTFGTGLLIKMAIESGSSNIIVGLGGSATIDGGAGMASALGYQLLDSAGMKIREGGGALNRLDSIHTGKINTRLRDINVIALTDVDNRLLGASGAAQVYGPQKGASKNDVEILERNLNHLAAIIERDLSMSVSDIPGAGAAGGLGAGCTAFLSAELKPGALWVAEHVGLSDILPDVDLVFTGEGQVDKQTAFGKVPAIVGQLARRFDKPVIAFAGSVRDAAGLHAIGIKKYIQIAPPEATLAESIRDAKKNLAKAAAAFINKAW